MLTSTVLITSLDVLSWNQISMIYIQVKACHFYPVGMVILNGKINRFHELLYISTPGFQTLICNES